jgi:hypothetical protein
MLTCFMLLVWARVLWTRRRARVRATARSVALRRRLERLVAAHEALAPLAARLRITEEEGFALGTQGLLRPLVYVGTSYAEGLSDGTLAAGLAHELEHVRARDPLRYLVLDLALAMNPFGRALLEPHVSSWIGAREAHCDREAVLAGSRPLDLADAIVRAARPGRCRTAAIGTGDTGLLRLRVGLLLAFSEKHPHRCCGRGNSAFPVAALLTLVACFLPHETSTAALDTLHASVEHALLLAWP